MYDICDYRMNKPTNIPQVSHSDHAADKPLQEINGEIISF